MTLRRQRRSAFRGVEGFDGGEGAVEGAAESPSALGGVGVFGRLGERFRAAFFKGGGKRDAGGDDVKFKDRDELGFILGLKE